MTKDEQQLIASAVRTAAFNGLLEDGGVSEDIANAVADCVEAEFLEQSHFLVARESVPPKEQG